MEPITTILTAKNVLAFLWRWRTVFALAAAGLFICFLWGRIDDVKADLAREERRSAMLQDANEFNLRAIAAQKANMELERQIAAGREKRKALEADQLHAIVQELLKYEKGPVSPAVRRAIELSRVR